MIFLQHFITCLFWAFEKLNSLKMKEMPLRELLDFKFSRGRTPEPPLFGEYSRVGTTHVKS